MDLTPLVHTAQLLGLSTSIFLAGVSFSTSHLALPVLYSLKEAEPQGAVPAVAFASLYHRSARMALPFAILSTLSSALVATQTAGRERAAWLVAALATLAGVPLTRAVLVETRRALLRFAGGETGEREALKGGRDVESEEVARLVKRWRITSVIRGKLALVGGLVAAGAVVFGVRGSV
ncbi:hypothetical protein JX265_003086 [Neoarthrinium moseri]|uniref:DUF1772-domain-containing protein n=1 Tax=Neoarthrinium moseri TaxID=1658444 RepID=A0A9P9WT94_9PEZI|nr:hypothetical protein JX265_003086 [Neoarthrinium moseri]